MSTHITARCILAAAVAATLSLSLNACWADEPISKPAATEKLLTKTKIVEIKLSSAFTERPASFSFSMFSGAPTKTPALSQLIVTLNKAAKDPAVSTVFLDLQSFQLSTSQAQEIAGLIKKLHAADKKVVVFSADFETGPYVLATNADTIIMPEQGNLMVPGASMGLVFIKGLLDKIHVQADMIQIGQFKGAEEALTRTEASPQFKEQIDGLVSGIYSQIIQTLQTNRHLDEKAAIAAIDEGWMTGKHAKDLKLVDQLMDREKVDKFLQSQEGPTPAGTEAEIVTDYGDARKKKLDMDSPFAIFSLFADAKPKTRTNQPAIAVIYADGEITGDKPEGAAIDDDASVTPSRIRKAVNKALSDDLVKAIVLRVDSPGGSASASDEIWQILKDADKQKPVTVSMGRLAASGGYYISCAGRSITADEATITGSIGVVGGKIVIKGLLDLIGVNIQPFELGKHAGMLGSDRPFNPEERQFVKNLMTETYDLFTSRVKAGRGDKIKDIPAVAQGRLFTGIKAKEVGLVDNLGTLNDTITAAAKTANISANFQIFTYPEPKTFADVIREGFQVDAKLPLELQTALNAAPPAYRRETLHLLRLVQDLQKERVMMALPVGLVER